MSPPPLFHVVLVAPEIPPNTGNVIRLCANTGAQLHLVEPLGFAFEDKALKRAGLDYHDIARISIHPDWSACCHALRGARMFAFTTRGATRFDRVSFEAGDVFVFGAETAGLPESVRAEFPPERLLRLPMQPSNRSMNLSNSVAVVVFEAWRQQGYPGAG